MEKFLAYKRQSPCLDENDIDYIMEKSRVRYVKENGIISKAGLVENNMTFIESGMALCTISPVTGKPSSLNILQEGQFATNVNSYIKSSLSTYDIIAIEETKVYHWDRLTFENARKRNINFLMDYANVLEKSFTELFSDYFSTTGKTALARYISLLKDCPEIVQRIPGKTLAAYLNITPERLSRIKSEIMNMDPVALFKQLV